MRRARWTYSWVGEDDDGEDRERAHAWCCDCRTLLGQAIAHPAEDNGSSSTLTLVPGLILRAGAHPETGYTRFGLPKLARPTSDQAFTRAPAWVYCPACGAGQVVDHGAVVEAVNWSHEPDVDDIGD